MTSFTLSTSPTISRLRLALSVDQVEEALKANTTGETTYTVVKGDTYNGIAYRPTAFTVVGSRRVVVSVTVRSRS